jgi:hypothetical protein
MGRQAGKLQVDSSTFQVNQGLRRNVIQAIEPEAERLLLSAGGKVLRNQEGYLYEEYLDCGLPTVVIYWPPQTRTVYLAARGQEDGIMIFVAALLPGLQAELHLTYDYRLSCPFGPFEEFFTLREALVRILAPASRVPP